MVTDPIADMLTRIKNASMAGRLNVSVPYSKMKEKVAQILVSEGYISSYDIEGETFRRVMMLTLKYQNKKPVLNDVKRKSKPGLRLYVAKDSIPTVLGGMGISILSTSAGLMTGMEARKRGIGGELLCIVW